MHIKGLTVATRIGIHDWEQRIQQRLVIDVTIPIDCSQCQDNLDKTIDYDTLCRRITEFLESQPFRLIETVAESIAALLKSEFNVDQVSVSVSKPFAIKQAKDVVVSITR